MIAMLGVLCLHLGQWVCLVNTWYLHDALGLVLSPGSKWDEYDCTALGLLVSTLGAIGMPGKHVVSARCFGTSPVTRKHMRWMWFSSPLSSTCWWHGATCTAWRCTRWARWTFCKSKSHGCCKWCLKWWGTTCTRHTVGCRRWTAWVAWRWSTSCTTMNNSSPTARMSSTHNCCCTCWWRTAGTSSTHSWCCCRSWWGTGTSTSTSRSWDINLVRWINHSSTNNCNVKS